VEERGPVGGADGDIEDAWASLDAEPFCYVTTVGRVSGRRHTIEIWFSLHGGTVYLLSGGGRASDWVRNLEKMPDARVRIGGREFRGRARIVTAPDEDHLARELVFAKYQPGYGGDLSGWRNRALPIAIDFSAFRGGLP
jgi:deazaflavin-dependent oxidoreductase (nitroreductase family)